MNGFSGRQKPSPFSIRLFVIHSLIFVAMAFVGSSGSEAAERSYPTKPITIIVPWDPGSAVDLVPRVMAPYLSKKLGVPVNIVNKPGGSGVPGTLEAVKAAPDGHTILADCPGTSSIQQAWMSDLPYKVEERTYMALAFGFPSGIVIRASAPWKTLQDLEQGIRKDPASFRWGAVGTTQTDYGMYLLKAALVQKGVDLSQTKTVSFKSGGATMIALAGGHVDIKCSTWGQAQPYVTGGKARVLAVMRAKRTQVFAGIPTTVEQGYPSVISDFWVGFSGPPGLSANVVQTWETLVKEIVNDPSILPEWQKIGGEADFLPRGEFKKFVMDEAQSVKAVSPYR
jgi:tripartite-type tricarboxylate transporter receptor subunit TctC